MDKSYLSKREILERVKTGQMTSDEAYHLIQALEFKQEELPEPVYFKNIWEEKTSKIAGIDTLKGCYLIFDTDECFFSVWKEQLKRLGIKASHVFLIKPGQEFRQTGPNVYEINPEQEEDYKYLVETVATQSNKPIRIIHLWSQDIFNGQESTMKKQLDKGVYSLFHLATTIFKQSVNDKLPLLYIYPYSETNSQPQYAGVGGFLKTLHQEDTRFIWKSVGVTVEDEARRVSTDELVKISIQEFQEENENLEIRYKQGKRLVKSLEERKLDTDETKSKLPLKNQGVYLITGGAGGLGLIFAEYLAKNVKANLVLVGRSKLNERKKQTIKELEQHGSKILYLQADLSKQADVERVIEQTRQQFHSLDGIIHGAGSIHDAFLFKKTREEIEKVLASKIYSTVLLDGATRDFSLDFFIMYSSVASVIGNIGQADYAFANGFLDHYAAYRKANKGAGQTLTINWPLWNEGGMRISEDERQLLKMHTGLEALPTTEGVSAWENALKSNELQFVVTYGKKQKIKHLWLNGFPKDESIHSKVTSNIKVNMGILEKRTEQFLKEAFSDMLKIPQDQLDTTATFQEYGIDSLMTKKFNLKLEQKFASTPKTLLFEYQTIDELKDYFVNNYQAQLISLFGLDQQTQDQTTTKIVTPISETCKVTNDMDKEWEMLESIRTDFKVGEKTPSKERLEDIAVIGLSGRYPGARNLDEFWEMLAKGQDYIHEIPKERWDWKEYFDSNPEKAQEGKIYSKWGAFLEDADKFDPLFFNIAPKEAVTMDPQERLFLEISWEAIEDAGYTRKQLLNLHKGLQGADVGVFAGVTTLSYLLWGADVQKGDDVVIPNTLPWSIANRVSFSFNFNGPSMPVDTACSSSLTAIHLACESLIKGECKVAIAGGVNLYLHPSKYMSLCQKRMLSATGKCHSFGEGGDGFVPGEGVGAVLLKPLKQAIADEDHIYGVIKGTAVNHGGSTNGYTVPNPNAQTQLLSDAWKKAGISPRTINYIEAHGTGTALGDPIEITGLTKAFEKLTLDKQFCSIGSLKSNIGHLESGAGIAGLTKILLQLKYRKLVPSLHSEVLNPNIDFANTPFYVQHHLEDWDKPTVLENGVERIYPRRAGISSFGAGGSNAHIVVEEYESLKEEIQSNSDKEEPFSPKLVVLSARNEERLREYAGKMVQFLRRETSIADESIIEDFIYTLQVGREAMVERLAFVFFNRNQLIHALENYHLNENSLTNVKIYTGNVAERKSSQPDKVDIQVAVESGNLDELASLFVMGAEVNWSQLYKGKRPKRISIPTYPFERERFWIGQREKNSEKNQSLKLHSLIDTNTSTLFEQKFVSKFTGNEFYLEDHVVSGRKVLPGVIHVEMARAAAELAGEQAVRRIKDITWAKPIAIDNSPAEVKVALYAEEELVTYEISVANQDGNDVVHSRGTVIYLQDQLEDEYVDLHAIQTRCTQLFTGYDYYRGFEKRGFAYGPRFKGIQKYYRSSEEAFAYLQLPEELVDQSHDFILHPTILDGALQTVAGLLDEDDESRLYLPFSIGEIDIYAPLPSNSYAHAIPVEKQTEGSQAFNVTVFGEDGQVFVRIRNFVVREFKERGIDTTSATEQRNSLLYYTPEWKNTPLDAQVNIDLDDTVVVFSPDEKISKALEPKIQGNIVMVSPGKYFHKKKDNNYEIQTSEINDFIRLIEALKEEDRVPSKILYLQSTDISTGVELQIDTDMERDVLALFYLSQALMKNNIFKKVQMLYIYQLNRNEFKPHISAIRGFAKTLRREHPDFILKTVELNTENHSLSVDKISSIALREWGVEDSLVIRYEQENRLEMCLKEQKMEKVKGAVIREKGVYLLTGGTGGLGMIFAKYLAKKYQAKLILTARSSSLDGVKQRQLAELESFGAEVLYVSADITTRQDVEHLINKAKSRFGKINGIIHGAGQLRDSLITQKTKDQWNEVIAAKVYGTILLEQTIDTKSLDFFALFSSMASEVGNVGQSDYAYGNAFMDEFAQMKVAQGEKQFISINWPLWKDGGMHVDESTVATFFESYGMVPLRTESGIAAFEQILHTGLAQVMVIEGNKERIHSVIDPIKYESDKQVVPEIFLDEKDKVHLYKKTEAFLKEVLSDEIGLSVKKISSKASFENYGVDSIMIMNLTRNLEKQFGNLPKTLFFEFKSIAELAVYFLNVHLDKLVNMLGETNSLRLQSQRIQSEYKDTKDSSSKHFRFSRGEKDSSLGSSNLDLNDIAIIGVSGVYPMANDVEEFMDNLRTGKDCITEVPAERWNHSEIYDSDRNKKGKTYAKWGGFIKDVDKFDPLFFNISPREAEIMDPQERLFLQTAWHTIEDAGYTKERLLPYKVGVYVGVMYGQYQLYGVEESLRGHVIALNSSYASIANRVSYCLNLRGPSVALDTMCSSSLTSIHFACESLQRGESDIALAGGVNLSIHPNKYIQLAQGKFASSDGRCRSFGEGGDGYVPGEGVGAVLLKPLKKAVADGDRIYAIVRSSSLNHGGKTNGYTVPSVIAQGDVIAETLKKADINPRTISYIEAHGTGTSLGDPIEISGLMRAFDKYTKDKQFCSIGSAKSNIGHLESAAGIAAVTKVLMQFKYKQLVPSLHSEILNPNIDFTDSPFRVQQKLEEWKRPVLLENGKEQEVPRRAAISSFGAGGSNAHLILEEYEAPKAVSSVQEYEPSIIVLSAKNKERLLAYANRLLHFLKQKKQTDVYSNQEAQRSEQEIAREFRAEILKIVTQILGVEESQIDFVERLDGLGFDAMSLNLFISTLNEQYGIDVLLNELLSFESFDTCISSLFQMYKDDLDKETSDLMFATESYNLSDLAYTLQIGREALEVRVAFIVLSIEELIEKLLDFVVGKRNIAEVYTGDIKTDVEKIEFLIDGKAGEDFVKTVIRERNLNKVASLWVCGLNINWNFLRGDSMHNIISLPGYPFEKERYWVSQSKHAYPVQRETQRLLPTIECNVSDLKEQKYMTRMSLQDFYIVDHKITGKYILPGAVYLQMACAAGKLAGNRSVRKLKNIVWWKEIVLPSTNAHLENVVDVIISLYPNEEAVEYEVSSMLDNGERTVHGQGEIIYANELENDVVDEVLDLTVIQSRCPNVINRDDFYKEYEELGFEYGASFRPIVEIVGNRKEFLARMELPSQLTADFSDYSLHPTLIDGAFQITLMYKKSLNHQGTYLPFAVGEVELFSPLPTECYVYVNECMTTDTDIYKFDICITDLNGKVLVRISDFSVRLLQANEKNLPNDIYDVLYYENQWQPSEIKFISNKNSFSGQVLLFDTEIDTKLYSDLNVIRVKQGNAYAELDGGIFTINPTNKRDYHILIETLINRGIQPDRIIHLWSETFFDTSETLLQMQLDRSVYSLFYLSQALMKQSPRHKIELAYVYVTNGDVQPIHAAVSGFTKSLHQENPQFVSKTIEVDEFYEGSLFELAMEELSSSNETEVRYERGVRTTKRLNPVDIQQKKINELPIKTNGVYLITGGAGGLGLIFASYLSQKVQATLILTGRSELNENQQELIRELEQNGAKIFYRRMDVTKSDDVIRVITDIKSKYGALNGIIHSAGVLRDSFMKNKTYSEMSAVIAPKVFGTLHLSNATENEPLDFFVMFSSITSLIGNIAQGDYAFANGFMDHFSARMNLQRPETRFMSLNWPHWQEGGMRVGESKVEWLQKTTGIVPLTKESGIQAFEYGLKASFSQLLIVEGNKEKINAFLNHQEPTTIEMATESVEKSQSVPEDLKLNTEIFLKETLSRGLNLPADRIHPKEPFESYGIDSVIIMELIRELEVNFGELPKTLFFEYQNITSLANYFIEYHFTKLVENIRIENKPQSQKVSNNPSEQIVPSQKPREKRNRFANHLVIDAPQTLQKEEEIAIIGLSGRYPMANNLEELWNNFKTGRDCISEIPKDRWDFRRDFDPDKNKEGKTYGKWGGFLNDIDKFDPLFFNISPKEAELLDPQERIFLETVWHAMEDGGYTKERLSQSIVGVYVGVMYGHYQMFGAEESLRGNPVALSSSFASIANRVSYIFNFHGPSIAIDTMCSSSLTAIHLACESLRRGESEVAVAGGVNLSIHPNKYLLLGAGKFLSTDGRCRAFGEGGDGYVPSEGVGAVLLKPLQKAISDGDRVYAVIKASALNHGGKTNGYSVPNPMEQGNLIEKTLEKANIHPRTISYIEAHGTGTSLGDPIEIAGLKKAFRKQTNDSNFCAIGSAKSNIGHLESAAGIVGLTKILLQFQYKQLVPSIHAESLNPNIKFKETPFYVQQTLTDWKRPVIVENGEEIEFPRRAGLSSFGAGGTNAHIIFEEYNEAPSSSNSKSQEPSLIIMSARDKERLKEMAINLIGFLENRNWKVNLASMAYTLQVGRQAMEERIAFVVTSIDELKLKLKGISEDSSAVENIYRGIVKTGKDKVEFSVNGTSGEEQIQSAIKKQNLDLLADYWVLGAEIDWMLLYAEYKPQVITLPGYPFAKERCWVPVYDSLQSTKENDIGSVEKLHPLIDKNVSDLLEQRYSTKISGRKFYMADHVISDRMLLPGSAYLEMARASGELATSRINGKVRKLQNITWWNAIAIPKEETSELDISTILHPIEGAVEYEICSEVMDGAKTVHGKGKIVFANQDIEKSDEEKIDLTDLYNRCPAFKSGKQFYRELEEKGFVYGTTFQTVAEGYSGEREAVARLELPTEMENSFDEYGLHPVLIDGAFQAVSLLNSKLRESLRYLPFSLREMTLLSPMATSCYVYIREKTEDDVEVRKFDIKIFNEKGHVLVQLQDFLLKAFPKYSNTKDDVLDMLGKLHDGSMNVDDVKQLIEVMLHD
ncbi:SDR family NAD(P)-dependent oxidoreductase (plasmid) [Bacillus cereus]|uniref:SDR family NAD(P)-dependent oxidoreductase n=1 Tax=Bacillus cereus TaxID=1396 RepID=UPI00156150DA|nr:SDR family NAD(P)-dependent oxidoreductase [Bacillus cereus]QKH04694.1 SDR family NAD(P)-dependent oxidoreductase [Bacillus cereus]QKH10747.1 SDR family NAD(P)-dependent oxidoreductase [Bacillus cereus]